MTEARLVPRTGEPPEAAARRLRSLLDINLALGAVADLDRLLGTILSVTRRALRCEAASVLLHDPRENVLRFAAATGDPEHALAEIRVPLAGSLAGTIFCENRPLLAVDVENDERHFTDAAEATGFDPRVLLGVPMRVEGRPIGVLEALNPHEAFDAVDAEMLLIVSSQAAVAIQNTRQREELESARARLADLDRLKSDFMAVASHELRTPLAALRGFGEILHEEVRPELAEPADEVVRASRRMQAIVETLEEMSALAAESGPAESRPVDLADVLTVAGADIDRAVAFQFPPAPLVVRAEPRRLHAAFGHLLRNAVQHTPPEAAIRVEAEASGEDAIVRVSDEGRGLAPGDAERIFEAFEQAERPLTRRTEGLGVGLTVARSAILRYGGRVWATSPGVGQGSTFHVRLPLAA
ncbi:MAG: HAMP domain-containing sensor histidine kinase [Bacteroidota bacterium]